MYLKIIWKNSKTTIKLLNYLCTLFGIKLENGDKILNEPTEKSILWREYFYHFEAEIKYDKINILCFFWAYEFGI